MEQEEDTAELVVLTGDPTPSRFLPFNHSSRLCSRCRGRDRDPPQVKVSVCVAELAFALFGRTKDQDPWLEEIQSHPAPPGKRPLPFAAGGGRQSQSLITSLERKILVSFDPALGGGSILPGTTRQKVPSRVLTLSFTSHSEVRPIVLAVLEKLRTISSQ